MNELSCKSPLLLRPRKSALVDKLLSRQELLRKLTLACGSPLNLLLPDQLSENLAGFRDVVKNHGLAGRIFFAHKSNQSASLIRQMAASDLNCDVASLEELRHALSAGFAGNRIEATGPKTPEFIALCVQHDVVINADSMQELDLIETVLTALGYLRKARVLIRFCGFSAPHTPVFPKPSRFGIPFRECEKALKMVAGSGRLELLGFSFHLDSVSIDERVCAIENCLGAFDVAIAMGMEPRVLDIGGGFRINYLEHEEDWNDFTSAIKQAALGTSGKDCSLTWQNNFFGLSSEAGVLRGKLNSYGYFEPRPGAQFLDDILNAELPGMDNRLVGDVLRDNMIELWIEPGRALLDQCGITLARVNGIKTSSTGDTIVGLAMKRQDLAFLDQEVFVDPIVVAGRRQRRRHGKDPEVPCQPVFIAGNLCLESDLIFRHKVSLPVLPKPGDLLAFINTAAYMMDFSATRSIMQPQARKVAVVQDGNQFVWMLDEQYSPVWRLTR